MNDTTFFKVFLEAGFSVIPLVFKSKKPLVRWTPFQSTPPDTEMAHHWFFNTQVNLGVVTGYNHLTVIDFDDYSEYLKWLAWLSTRPTYSVARNAFTVRSSRGVHVYIRTLHPERNRHMAKVDIKGRFGYVTGPGSTHASGAIYTPLNEFFIPTVEHLSDVLPAQLLLSVLDISPVVKVPVTQPVSNDDIWNVVNRGNSAMPGEDVISVIRRTFRIEQFFTTPMKQTGPHFVITNCPFHDDQTPSFWIDTEHQVCGCFTCNFGKPWDVINLYGALYGLANLEAIWAMSRLI